MIHLFPVHVSLSLYLLHYVFYQMHFSLHFKQIFNCQSTLQGNTARDFLCYISKFTDNITIYCKLFLYLCVNPVVLCICLVQYCSVTYHVALDHFDQHSMINGKHQARFFNTSGKRQPICDFSDRTDGMVL